MGGEKSPFSGCLSHYANAEFISHAHFDYHNMIYETLFTKKEMQTRLGLPMLALCEGFNGVKDLNVLRNMFDNTLLFRDVTYGLFCMKCFRKDG